ncbi:oxidoreductase [Actinomadura parmotrematis]|uniref:Alkene reductase n=1 Tax=Actinomadura parmotrematis TaxID=2864039 RepID=A0ABS7FP65_9ACTN|nr:alkene reductase [Actinomadura parmotrematis]MBW8481785.1 alkene reductase [Actinomadura parmotrematis]
MTVSLLDPYTGPHLRLPNRVAMAPVTRGRADDATGVPHPAARDYYAQRASAGLIVTEGIWPHRLGKGEPGVPGLVTAEQAAGWRAVTGAVHAAGGRIFAQLWHVGRMSHPLVLDGAAPVAPSAVRIEGEYLHTAAGRRDHVTPRALETAEVEELVGAFAAAARAAVGAGFDGVEVHGANGYLIQQFLGTNTNRRTDRYAEPTLFAREVVRAVAAAVGPERTALRISPGSTDHAIDEADPRTVYRALLADLDPLGLAYLHIVERGAYCALADLRPRWSGTLIGNLDGPEPTTREAAERAVQAGLADVFSFGRLFIANPDLPARFAAGAPLNPLRPTLIYGGGHEGYTDYPPLPTPAHTP